MKAADYPPGCTQAMHDAAFNPDPDAENERMARIEEMAQREIRTCSMRFCDWLSEADGDQRYNAARLIAASFGWGETTGIRQTLFWELQGLIEHDYTQWLAEQEDVCG